MLHSPPFAIFSMRNCRTRSFLFITLAFGIAVPLFSDDSSEYLKKIEGLLLPSPFYVYTSGDSVINVPAPGTQKKELPTVNKFRGAPGCYVACYARGTQGAIYSVGGGIQVRGQVRVRGRYVGRICRPTGHEKDDISALRKFKDACNQAIRACGTGCWAGGDTGGWFGIQDDGSVNFGGCSRDVRKLLET